MLFANCDGMPHTVVLPPATRRNRLTRGCPRSSVIGTVRLFACVHVHIFVDLLASVPVDDCRLVDESKCNTRLLHIRMQCTEWYCVRVRGLCRRQIVCKVPCTLTRVQRDILCTVSTTARNSRSFASRVYELTEITSRQTRSISCGVTMSSSDAASLCADTIIRRDVCTYVALLTVVRFFDGTHIAVEAHERTRFTHMRVDVHVGQVVVLSTLGETPLAVHDLYNCQKQL